MVMLVALDSLAYGSKVYSTGDTFEVGSDVHAKQLLMRGLVRVHTGGDVKKKEPSLSLPPAPVSPNQTVRLSKRGRPRKTEGSLL